MKNIKLTIFFMILTVLAILSGGCSKSDNPTLAVVGDHEIDFVEFNDYFNASLVTFASAEDEFQKKMEILDSLIRMRIFIKAAYEKGIDQSEDLSRIILANRNKFLLDALYANTISSKVDPSDAEVRDYYNKLEYKLRASHILVGDPDTAQMIFERAKAGDNFEELAYKYSADNSAKRNRGDLGYFTWGAMVDGFQDAAFAMEPGEISPPVKSSFGYHIIKLVEKSLNEQREDFNAMKKNIYSQIKKKKETKLLDQYLTDIQAKYPITVDTSVTNYLLHKREALYPPQVLKSLPKNDFDMEQLDRNERELVLAFWDGGQITISQYLTLIKNIRSDMKYDFDQPDSLGKTIFQLKTMDILVNEAIREGIDNDPEFVRKVQFFKELNMGHMMQDDSIPTPLEPTEPMIRQYYDEHPEEYSTPRKIRIFEIMVSDKAKAEKLAKSINSLEMFQEMAMDHTERSGKRKAKGDFGYIQKHGYEWVFDEAWEAPVNSMVGPVESAPGKYSLVWVEDKQDMQLKDYIGQKGIIYQKLEAEQKSLAVENWLNERKKEIRIVINEDAVRSTIDQDAYTNTNTTTTEG